MLSATSIPTVPVEQGTKHTPERRAYTSAAYRFANPGNLASVRDGCEEFYGASFASSCIEGTTKTFGRKSQPPSTN